MNILVTGGAGYIGSHTVLELIAAGYQPVVIDNFANSSKEVIKRLGSITGTDIPYYDFDYQDTDKLKKILQDQHIEGAIHFAAHKAVGESVEKPLKYYENNVSGFVTLLGVLIEGGIQTVIFSSSAAVYGTPPSSPVTETTPCQPESPYGWSKYMDEVVLRDTCKANPHLRGVGLRYFNVVGAHESGDIGEYSKNKPQNLLPILVEAIRGNLPPVTVYGTDYDTPDGTCLRDYIHVTDLAKAHVAALTRANQQKDGSFEVYNIGTGKPTSVLELINTFERVNNIKVPHTLGERRPGDPVACYASADKAKQELDWESAKTIEDACRDTWNWISKNPNGYV